MLWEIIKMSSCAMQMRVLKNDNIKVTRLSDQRCNKTMKIETKKTIANESYWLNMLYFANHMDETC